MTRKHAILVLVFSLFACNRKEASPKENKNSGVVEVTDSSSVKTLDSISTDSLSPLEDSGKWQFEPMSKKAQSVFIPSDKDTLLTFAEGTKIKIFANSFISEKTHKAVNGRIEIKVREFYGLGHILRAGLSTTSEKRLLETGGMLFIDAFSDAGKCKLKTDQTLEIAFAGKPKTGMELFTGKADKDSIVDWNLAYTQEMMISEGGEGTAIFNNLKFNIDMGDLYRNAKGVLRILVDENGKVNDARMATGITPYIDKQILKQAKLQTVTTQMINGKPRTGWLSFPIYVNNGDYVDAPTKMSEAEVKRVEKMQETVELSTFFPTSELGWINCDRFLDYAGRKVDLAFKIEQDEVITVMVVFGRYRSVMRQNSSGPNVVFKSIPKGEPITVIAIKSGADGVFVSNENLIADAGPKAFSFRKSDRKSIANELSATNWKP